MIRIAIVDDDEKTLNELNTLCSRYFTESNLKFTVSLYKSGIDFLSAFKDNSEIVLLDVDMPLMNGLDTAKMIREIGSRCAIAFVSNLTQFVLKGYEVAAHGYVLKPVTYEKLKRLLNRIVSAIDKDPKKRIILRINGDVVVIAADSICYVEVISHNVIIHTDKQVYRLNDTLTSIEKQLDGVGFARCNHSFLVNLGHVEQVTGNDVIVSVGDGKETLSMSRNKKTAFVEALVNFTR